MMTASPALSSLWLECQQLTGVWSLLACFGHNCRILFGVFLSYYVRQQAGTRLLAPPAEVWVRRSQAQLLHLPYPRLSNCFHPGNKSSGRARGGQAALLSARENMTLSHKAQASILASCKNKWIEASGLLCSQGWCFPGPAFQLLVLCGKTAAKRGPQCKYSYSAASLYLVLVPYLNCKTKH